MSDALDALIKARPDAMGHYFSFLKEAGKHLDPKTRNLISVITKVDAQTERGFRQYLRRALREGCTTDEVLDALLMAFPTLGLTKIVWAMDILIDMKLAPAPTVATVPVATEEIWHDLLAVDDTCVGAVRRVDCDGRSVFVYRGADEFRVYDSVCPHQSTDIPQTALDETCLTCPKHGWTFDLTSGDCVAKGSAPLTQWESRVEGGRLQARW